MKKDYLKKTMHIIMQTILVLLTMTVLITCSLGGNENIQNKTNDEDENKIVMVSFGCGGVKSRANDINDAVSVIVSIKDDLDNPVYTRESLLLVGIGINQKTEPIPLTVGNYYVTEFLVLDASEDVIFATPVTGANLDYLVDNPMPMAMNLTAATDQLLVVPEIINADGKSLLDDFGYSGGVFTVVETFEFIINVKNESVEFITANLDISVSSPARSCSLSLAAETNVITIWDEYTEYDLTITSPGYYDQNMTVDLHDYISTPLEVVLIQTPPTFNVYSEVNHTGEPGTTMAGGSIGASLWSWSEFGDQYFVEITYDYSEGTNALEARCDNTAAPNTTAYWIQFDNSHDLSFYADGYIKFSVKTTSTDVWIKIKDINLTEVYLGSLDNQYTTGNWEHVSLKLSDFIGFDSLDMSSIINPFIIGTAWPYGNPILVDDIRYDTQP